MIKAAIEYIVGLSKPLNTEINGRQYFQNQSPVLEPVPSKIVVHTLSGLVDFLKDKDHRQTNSDETILHVVDYSQVVAKSALLVGPFSQRFCYASAELFPTGRSFQWGQFYDLEQFNIELQSKFVQDQATAAILSFIGSVTDSNVKQTDDDGITQSVTVRKGITKKAEGTIPNPIQLRPYRTFPEIEQPEINFVFRMRAGKEGDLPTAALFEADGGLWRNRATESIREYMKNALPNYSIIA